MIIPLDTLETSLAKWSTFDLQEKKFWFQILFFLSIFWLASFQPFSFFLVCRRGWSPAGTCSPACQSCDREIDHISYSAFIYRPRLQSIWPVGEESDFRFKVARTGNRTRDTSSWPRFFPSALSTRPTLLPPSLPGSFVSANRNFSPISAFIAGLKETFASSCSLQTPLLFPRKPKNKPDRGRNLCFLTTANFLFKSLSRSLSDSFTCQTRKLYFHQLSVGKKRQKIISRSNQQHDAKNSSGKKKTGHKFKFFTLCTRLWASQEKGGNKNVEQLSLKLGLSLPFFLHLFQLRKGDLENHGDYRFAISAISHTLSGMQYWESQIKLNSK